MEESFKYHIPEDIPANERTAFHGAAAAAAKAGKKNFNFAGKTHPVTMKKDTATAIADQKEGFMNEEYSKTNKASMTIKHGYDEGDGPDNKKFAKYINKNTGATVKHHKDGSTMSFHGSDHQIHKALQIHHSDDKKGLGDLNYHKKGKTHSDDHVDGQHTYKAEGTTFREKLMSIFESDRAKHYKSAAAAEPMDNNLKGAGAKKMKADIQGNAADPDLEKKSHDDAAKAGRAGPSMKARSNDNKKGDKKIINPPTDETKKGQGPKVATESYGVSGNTVSKGLLDAIGQVTEKRQIRTNRVRGDRTMHDDHVKTGMGMGGEQTYSTVNKLDQRHYAKYISKKSGHDSYFDGNDLVHTKSSKTVVPNALISKKHTPDQLAAKMKAHGDKHKG